jgi:transmembrane sensor
MEHRTHNRDEETLISERAFEWLRSLDHADDRTMEAFHTWVSRSPQNGGEVLIATSTELALRQLFRSKRIDVDQFLSTSVNVLSIGEHSGAHKEPTRKRRLRLFSIAGLGIAATTAALFLAPAVVRNWLHSSEYTTSVGEQRSIELPDGSAIAINTQSSVRIEYSTGARDVYLDRGQAMFTVAKNASRPFRVHVAAANGKAAAAGAVIQALGTKFDVRRRTDRINVAVVEGVVQVGSNDSAQAPLQSALRTASAPAKVAAGQTVNVESTGLITPPASINLSEVSAWQQRRLVFTDDTLGDIAEEFARYNRSPHIRIEGDDLRMRRLSGVFDADNPEGLLRYLGTDASVDMALDGDDIVIRSRSDIDPSP